MKIHEISVVKQSIFVSSLEDIDNSSLIAELDSYYLNISNANVSSDMRFPLAGPECAKLKNGIDLQINAVAGKEMECREFWMFSLTNGGSVPIHNHWTNYQLHPEEYYSIAYYPAVPRGSARLHFSATYCRLMKQTISVNPEPGMLIIFNSYIDHYTDKNTTFEKRTCISANYRPVVPDKSLVSDWASFALPRPSEDARFSKFS